MGTSMSRMRQVELRQSLETRMEQVIGYLGLFLVGALSRAAEHFGECRTLAAQIEHRHKRG